MRDRLHRRRRCERPVCACIVLHSRCMHGAAAGPEPAPRAVAPCIVVPQIRGPWGARLSGRARGWRPVRQPVALGVVRRLSDEAMQAPASQGTCTCARVSGGARRGAVCVGCADGAAHWGCVPWASQGVPGATQHAGGTQCVGRGPHRWVPGARTGLHARGM